MLIQPVCLVTLLSNLPLPEPSHSRTVAAKVLVKALSDAIDRHKAGFGEYPSELMGLRGLAHDLGTPNWQGPYLQVDRPLDPWAHSYVYRRNGSGRPEVVSYGADGEPGGTGVNADVSSLDLTATANSGVWAKVLRFALFAVSAMGFFGYQLMPALLARLNLRLTRYSADRG